MSWAREVLIARLIRLLRDDLARPSSTNAFSNSSCRPTEYGCAWSYRIAAFVAFSLSFSRANLAHTQPWNGSMKQTRKIMSPIFVTSGLVDDGETIGTPFSWQIGAPASDSLEATSPSTAATPSRVISRVTAVPASRASPLSSYVMSRTFLPLMPPAGVDFLDRQLDAVVGRLAERRLRAGHRRVMTDDDFVGIASLEHWRTSLRRATSSARQRLRCVRHQSRSAQADDKDRRSARHSPRPVPLRRLRTSKPEVHCAHFHQSHVAFDQPNDR